LCGYSAGIQTIQHRLTIDTIINVSGHVRVSLRVAEIRTGLTERQMFPRFGFGCDRIEALGKLSARNISPARDIVQRGVGISNEVIVIGHRIRSLSLYTDNERARLFLQLITVILLTY
jgi:hypothetical protein